jgi:hypothetical protein
VPSAGPFPLTSAAYATEFNQVKSLGSLNSTTRTMFQTNSCLCWAENGARTWFRIFRTVSAQEGLTLEENRASLRTGAAARTLQNLFGTDHIAWTDTTLGGQTRSFTRASDAMNEVVDARVWSGIHFLRADEHGAQIGRQVADWANTNFFRPVG